MTKLAKRILSSYDKLHTLSTFWNRALQLCVNISMNETNIVYFNSNRYLFFIQAYNRFYGVPKNIPKYIYGVKKCYWARIMHFRLMKMSSAVRKRVKFSSEILIGKIELKGK